MAPAGRPPRAVGRACVETWARAWEDPDTDPPVTRPLQQVYDEDQIRRLKDKRERSRRAALGEFIPLEDKGHDHDHDGRAPDGPPGGMPDLSADDLERRMMGKQAQVGSRFEGGGG
jgi:hypothetical protein